MLSGSYAAAVAGFSTTAQPTAAQPTAAQPTAAQPTAAQLTTAQPMAGQPKAGHPTVGPPQVARPAVVLPRVGQVASKPPSKSMSRSLLVKGIPPELNTTETLLPLFQQYGSAVVDPLPQKYRAIVSYSTHVSYLWATTTTAAAVVLSCTLGYPAHLAVTASQELRLSRHPDSGSFPLVKKSTWQMTISWLCHLSCTFFHQRETTRLYFVAVVEILFAIPN